jgi:hypothetical protein
MGQRVVADAMLAFQISTLWNGLGWAREMFDLPVVAMLGLILGLVVAVSHLVCWYYLSRLYRLVWEMKARESRREEFIHTPPLGSAGGPFVAFLDAATTDEAELPDSRAAGRVRFFCPHCESRLVVHKPHKLKDGAGRCPGCGEMVVVPPEALAGTSHGSVNRGKASPLVAKPMAPGSFAQAHSPNEFK